MVRLGETRNSDAAAPAFEHRKGSTRHQTNYSRALGVIESSRSLLYRGRCTSGMLIERDNWKSCGYFHSEWYCALRCRSRWTDGWGAR